MIDYFLKFADQAEAEAVLFEGEERQAKYPAIDVIGTIYKPTGNMIQTDEGEVPEMAALDGWHVNVRHTEESPDLAAFQIFPQTPSRMWA